MVNDLHRNCNTEAATQNMAKLMDNVSPCNLLRAQSVCF